MKKVFLYVMACRRRSLDAKKISNYLVKNNFKIIQNPKDADLIIYVTCGFLDDITEFSLNKIKEFQKYNAELIVAGCLPEIEKERLRKIFKGKIISTKDLYKIDSIFPQCKIPFTSFEDENIPYKANDTSTMKGSLKNYLRKIKKIDDRYSLIKRYILEHVAYGRTPFFTALHKKSYHIRTSWGCVGNCSYCGIKKAIGPFKSKSSDECINELKKGLKEGYTNFILESDDIGAYGIDMGMTFPELLDKLTKITGHYHISFRALSPQWLVKYIDELDPIFKRKKIISIGIAIQSPISRILNLMNRYSDMDKIKEICLRVRKDYPYISFDTHYILGFPTETEEEFKKTLVFIKEINYRFGYLIPYSPKSNTDAEKMEPKVNNKEMGKRLKYAKKYLRKLGYRVIFFSEDQCHFLLFDKRH